MRYFMLAIITLVSLNLQADEQMLKETLYKYVKQSIGHGKPHFVEVGSDSCHSCQIMGKTLYKVTKENPTYNINFVNVKKERMAAYDMGIRMIPTQIIYDKNGKEVFRHIGIIPKDELLKLFKTYKFN
jgi:thioredoxin 1